jgi:hypothetical protein
MRYRMLSATNDYVFGNGPGEFLVDSPAAVAQAILTRLRLIQGEWFLDSTVGIPYNTQVLGFGTSGLRDAAIQTAIQNTPGVNQIVSYSSQLVGRAYSVQATVNTIYGQTQVSTSL